ncbi:MULTISPECIES: cupin domain-containing protein [unclassified Undibacterium]|uniref:cupin domain-containing protein n=1 Tax=unclassified Undibacterium TaxID=2630295 RepID=UPI002AC9E71B|nr:MULTISPECIES: cupin domain-containing protein [unclassified Undibacterium]MEB0139543.1 cupin domain-containing protein [Undibacterium sp. CCC2.1]MEB0172526.1 cupin domain-containing protein [Undibacterium sp. CCC1.1]MEB0178145.1 cupin domain-containing protein [Undibacterium sp. CCC3.4]MEB0215602.1 cupin domain-containing protein [Undibacterium sp. 5I2]WPX43999.1 cupin domain-containing protein [Undibacterium sp. CCC3.4]
MNAMIVNADASPSATQVDRPVETTPGNFHNLGLPFVLQNQSGFNFWDVKTGDYFIEMEGRYYGWDNATVQISEVGCGYGAPSHMHSVEEIFVLVEGEGAIVIDGKTFPIKAPCVVRVPPNTPHAIVSLGTGRMKMVDFFPTNHSGGAPSDMLDPFEYIKTGGNERNAMIDNFKKILADFDADRDGKLSKDEAPIMLRDSFERYDTDGDGFITLDDAKTW